MKSYLNNIVGCTLSETTFQDLHVCVLEHIQENHGLVNRLAGVEYLEQLSKEDLYEICKAIHLGTSPSSSKLTKSLAFALLTQIYFLKSLYAE